MDAWGDSIVGALCCRIVKCCTIGFVLLEYSLLQDTVLNVGQQTH